MSSELVHRAVPFDIGHPSPAIFAKPCRLIYVNVESEDGVTLTEQLWGAVCGPDVVELCSVPFLTEVIAPFDLLEINDEGYVTDVVRRAGYIVKHLRKHEQITSDEMRILRSSGVFYERSCDGFMSLSYTGSDTARLIEQIIDNLWFRRQ